MSGPVERWLQTVGFLGVVGTGLAWINSRTNYDDEHSLGGGPGFDATPFVIVLAIFAVALIAGLVLDRLARLNHPDDTEQ